MKMLKNLLSWHNKKTKNSGVLCKDPTVEIKKMEDKFEIENNEVPKKKDANEKSEHLVSGKYTATIDNAKYSPHPVTKHDVIKIWFDVEDEKSGGEMVLKSYNIKNQESKAHFVGEMKKLGIYINSRHDLKNAPGKVMGKKVTINVSYNDQDYPVIYILGLAKDNAESDFDPDSLWQ